MSLILLIDLDDTLISNSMETFIPAYLQALGNRLSEHGDPELLISKLLLATDCMMNNNRPNFTLEETFNENYYPEIYVGHEKVKPAIDDFYANHFPSLKPLTGLRKEAIELVEEGFRRGYQIVIATNPLFPKTAIYQRLEWGQLSPENYEFSIVSYFEQFHFAKPNPAYFAEILAYLGWPDRPVVMIGNDMQADIESAQKFGLATYHIIENNGYAQATEFTSTLFGRGWLDDVFDWIDSHDIEEFKPQFDSPAAVTAILRSTPAVLDTMMREFPEEKLSIQVTPDEWSLTEIFCHLRDVDGEIYLPRIQSILSEDNPFIEAVDADRWANERNYFEQDGAQAFRKFISNRIKILEVLDGLDPEDWNKPARHTIFGPTTLVELLRIFSRHDRLHVQQILQSLEKL